MKVNTAIVLAGGNGSRMQSDIPKQYICIDDKPIIYYSLMVFESADFIDNIVLVTREEDIEYCRREIVENFNLTKVTDIVAGGAERYLSVYNGLQKAAESQYVWIHDGARPCVSVEILMRLQKSVVEYNAVVAAVPSKDTIKIADNNQFVEATPDRNRVWNIQTPQVFGTKKLLAAYTGLMSCENKPLITDDAMIMEQFSDVLVRLEMGEYTNIKVTTPEDIDIVKKYLKKCKNSVDI